MTCLYPCGTTGEMMYLTVEERKQVAEIVVKQAAGRVPVFVHVGAWNQKDTIEEGISYALEKIDDIKYYLHKQQIEVVDYSKDTAQYFDLMPGTQSGTIRPALVADGVLLKKGLAQTGK